MSVSYDCTATLRAQEHGHQPVVCTPVVYEPASMLAENWHESNVKNALRSGESKSSHAVVYSSGSFGSLSEGVGTLGTGSRATAEMVAVYPQITGSLCANSHSGSYTGQDAFNNMLPVIPSDKPPRKYIIRRLTPLECCRLQGFPDWWEDGVEGSDSARYKMWGNGIALPCAEFVLRRIAEFVRIERMGW